MQPANAFKTLKILHTAILGGLIIFTILSIVVPRDMVAGKADHDMEMILQAIAAGVSLLSLLVGFNLFKKRLVIVRNSAEPAEQRFAMYRAACIMWWALIDGPGIFAIISYFLTGNYAFLALALFQMALLAVFMPRKDNIVLLLNLTSDDVQKLEGRK